MKIKKQKDREWVIDFTHEKKRIRRIIKGTRRMAEEAVRKLQEDITNEKYGLTVPGKKIRLEDYVEEYEENYIKGTKSEKNRKYIIGTLMSEFKGKFLTEITPGKIDRYKTKRQKDGVSNVTINRELALLKAIFNKAIDGEEYEINRNPVAKAGLLPEDSRRERILTVKEMDNLIKVAENPWGNCLPLFLLIALNTGMRKMEILSLKWEHVDLKRRYLIVPEERSKNGKERKVPMNNVVYEALKKLKRNNEYIFYSPKTGSHIKNIKTAFWRACDKAGIKNLTVHDLRHTAASFLVNDCGIDIVTAARILGHSDIQQTVKYVHPSEAHKRLGVERLGEIFKTGRHKSKPHAGLNDRFILDDMCMEKSYREKVN